MPVMKWTSAGLTGFLLLCCCACAGADCVAFPPAECCTADEHAANPKAANPARADNRNDSVIARLGSSDQRTYAAVGALESSGSLRDTNARAQNAGCLLTALASSYDQARPT